VDRLRRRAAGPLRLAAPLTPLTGALTSLQADAAIGRPFGMQLIIICRFIPGGRTAITLTCGLIGYSRRRFVAGTAAAP
jgi:membrane protein DedA with SNARE-associated domain